MFLHTVSAPEDLGDVKLDVKPITEYVVLLILIGWVVSKWYLNRRPQHNYIELFTDNLQHVLA